MSAPHPNLIEVPVGKLDVGMYVAQLDRPWLETPFALQGFYVQSAADVDSLAEYCDYVYVDPRRVKRVPTTPVKRRSERGPRTTYTNTVAMKDEFITIEVDYESANTAIARVFEQLKKGTPLNVAAVAKAINPLIDSILRNRDALAALVRIKKKDDYTYAHCLSTAVWSAILGRQLGLDKPTLKSLALGAALTDVGKIDVDPTLLAKPARLDEAEMDIVRDHVQHSMRIVKAAGVSAEVLSVIESHHERHDGSGYPRQLSGTAIPLLARIAGIADSYDAMITPRPYAAARASFEAMQELADLKNVKFQGELVEQFMQAVGLFPTGSLVELNTGEVAIVVSQNPSRRLKPKVMIVLDSHKRRCPNFTVVDLLSLEVSPEQTKPLWIAKELAPGSHGVDAEEFYL
ncbi:MAG: HD-GYP domain-containing protein [Gammaproteobacteria bacterium]|nr:HD-GYP domain-containing protein [Gammaproteobacteria bacterium]